MNNRDQKPLREKKQRTRLRALLVFVIVALIALLGYFLVAASLLLLFYIAHEVVWSDHNFYDPEQDYQYKLESGRLIEVEWNSAASQIKVEPYVNKSDTFLIEVIIESGTLGKVFDPFVEISFRQRTIKQYFERGAKGLRYINISQLMVGIEIERSITLEVKLGYCKISQSSCRLFAFENPDFKRKKVMIIAPHADDAELTAYGLYSDCKDVMIVTITAGETESEPLLDVYDDIESASCAKGRLRALDSVTAAVWGGINSGNVVSLGYFCQTLQEMAAKPQVAVRSKTANTGDTGAFRIFNTVRLQTDGDGKATWSNLISDLRELVAHFEPEVIVTPHPQLDPHADHIYATKAVLQSVRGIDTITDFLFYANHLHYTDQYPFGPVHTPISLPPNFNELIQCSFYSHPLDMARQRDKVFALEVMHDLKPQIDWKKKLRRWLQAGLVDRPMVKYGEDDYFRKMIRSNEIFYRVSPTDPSLRQFNIKSIEE
jgi:LmbE family N-acetylglucosaminyl deacetylase